VCARCPALRNSPQHHTRSTHTFTHTQRHVRACARARRAATQQPHTQVLTSREQSCQSNPASTRAPARSRHPGPECAAHTNERGVAVSAHALCRCAVNCERAPIAVDSACRSHTLTPGSSSIVRGGVPSPRAQCASANTHRRTHGGGLLDRSPPRSSTPVTVMPMGLSPCRCVPRSGHCAFATSSTMHVCARLPPRPPCMCAHACHLVHHACVRTLAASQPLGPGEQEALFAPLHPSIRVRGAPSASTARQALGGARWVGGTQSSYKAITWRGSSRRGRASSACA